MLTVEAGELPLTLIGYWASKWEPWWPRAADFVDEHWDSAEREPDASYLDQGIVPWAQAGFSRCRFCGAVNGSLERTDGVYIWPEGLAHYLREHGVRPPVSVIRHIVSFQASTQLPPTEAEEWWKTLHDDEGSFDDGVMPNWWLEARINRDWWKRATLDS